jgi:hypothetical protein
VNTWLISRILAVAFGVALLAPMVARAATVRVASATELATALAVALPGDVIELAPGAYGTVTIAARGGPQADLTLAGDPGATVSGMNITASTRIVVSGLSVEPAGATAYVNVDTTNGVTFSNLHLDGGAGGPGTAIWLTPDDVGVVIRDSTFLHCATPMCIRASSPGVLIEHNVFDELDDSDAVHGFGSGVIRYNHMDHALPAGDGNHNDFIQIGDGGPWTIDANWFGVRTGGAASIWVDSINKGVIHDVLIQNNVLTGHYVGQDAGIFVAGDDRQVALLPANVRILNNTVTTGLLNSLRFGANYANLPVEQRPLVANNVGDRLRDMCGRIRSEYNVFADGEACSATDVIGNAALNDAGAPTAASALLLGRGDPLVAPPADYFGCPRAGAPDIGAIQFAGCPAATALPPAPAAGEARGGGITRSLVGAARARIVSLRSHRRGRRVVLVVRCSDATRLVASVLVAGRVLAKASHSVTSGAGTTFKLRVPRSGRINLRIRAVGAGGSVVRTISLSGVARSRTGAARARITSLRSRRHGRQLVVVVRSRAATRLVASLLVRGRVVIKASQRVSLRRRTTFKLRVPRAGRVKLRIRAVGAGGSVVRTISLTVARR